MSKKIYVGFTVICLFLVFMAYACNGKPDLVVDSITITPPSPGTCDRILIKAVIKNKGKEAAPPSKAAMWVGGETNPRIFNIPALASGAVHTIQRSEALNVIQNYRVRVAADHSNTVRESNENNNKKYKDFTLKVGCPDLIVKDLELVQNCKINVTIKNIGTAGVPPAGYDLQNGVAIQMYRFNQPWGGIRLGAVDTGTLLMTPGNSVSWIWFPGAANLNLTPGTHSIKVVVDNNNAVAESDETNNSRTERLTCEK